MQLWHTKLSQRHFPDAGDGALGRGKGDEATAAREETGLAEGEGGPRGGAYLEETLLLILIIVVEH